MSLTPSVPCAPLAPPRMVHSAACGRKHPRCFGIPFRTQEWRVTRMRASTADAANRLGEIVSLRSDRLANALPTQPFDTDGANQQRHEQRNQIAQLQETIARAQQRRALQLERLATEATKHAYLLQSLANQHS